MTSAPTYRLHDSLGYQLSIAARIQEKRLDDGLKALALADAALKSVAESRAVKLSEITG